MLDLLQTIEIWKVRLRASSLATVHRILHAHSMFSRIEALAYLAHNSPEIQITICNSTIDKYCQHSNIQARWLLKYPKSDLKLENVNRGGCDVCVQRTTTLTIPGSGLSTHCAIFVVMNVYGTSTTTPRRVTSKHTQF
eukprot:6196766-Pleurochrysis_carterae.AAC.1